MRYIIETENNDLIKDFIEGRIDAEIIDQYDPIEKLTSRVEKMNQAFNDFKKNRGSWRIMNYYLRGRGISQTEIDNVTQGIEEFLALVK